MKVRTLFSISITLLLFNLTVLPAFASAPFLTSRPDRTLSSEFEGIWKGKLVVGPSTGASCKNTVGTPKIMKLKMCVATNPNDNIDELSFGLMFHSFDYPDETGKNELASRFWQATMREGILEFPRPEECELRRFIRLMTAKQFGLNENLLPVDREEAFL